jgi:glucose-6-phosphate dehydrogenase assembly protein OpcA
MAGSLAGRAWRPSAPERLDDDLTDLWREVARDAPVSRAVMSNLVVFCRPPADAGVDLAAPPADLPIEAVAGQHPARLILMYHDSAPAGAAVGTPRPIDAHVGVLTFGAPESRYGVEEIVIRSTCDEVALPSIVRALMHGDVPTSIWWTEDLSRARPLSPIVSLARQLLYDSRCWGDVPAAIRTLAPLLDDPFGPDLSDLNWRRLTPVRLAVVHAVASSADPRRALPAPFVISHEPGEAALAWLMAGWLVAGEAVPPDVAVEEDARLAGAVLTASFGGKLRLRLDANQVTIEDALGPAPFTVTVPREDTAGAVAAELRSLTRDPCLREALAALVRRFGIS